MKIDVWLGKLGLAQYSSSFSENDIDFDVLAELNADDLREIGVSSIGHRRKILSAAAKIENGAPEQGNAQDVSKSDHPTQTPDYAGGPERRHLTVLFSDLVGSTRISTGLDPEEMGELIQDYQSAVASAVRGVEGYISQYLGDGVVAYFGYPVAHEREQERAINAGLAIVDAVSRLTAPSGEPLAARVGVATGLVVVGDLLSHGDADVHAVVGDTPNLAARLQALGDPGDVIIASETMKLVEGRFKLESLGSLDVNGLSDAIEPWRVKGVVHQHFEFNVGRNFKPLIGREVEIKSIGACWESANEGQPQLLQIKGDPGIGKSRITEQVLSHVRETGGLVQRLYCSPFNTNAAYFPVIELVERLANIEHSDQAEARLEKLDAMMAQRGISAQSHGAVLAQLLSLPNESRYPPQNLAPTALRGRTFEVLADVLLSRDEEQTQFFALEDAHWMDPTTTDFWDYLLSVVGGRRVMFLMTYRPEYEAKKSPGTVRRTYLEIWPLSDKSAGFLIEAVTLGKPLPDEVISRILDKADGNPLFIEELTKTAMLSDAIVDAGDSYELVGSLDEQTVPNTLQDSLMARLERLSPVREITQIASVIGRRFHRSLLVRLGIMPEATLDSAIQVLVESELVVRSGRADDTTLTFKHALIRDAAYESVLLRRRMDLHARIARALEEESTTGMDVTDQLIAQHYTAAKQPGQAAPYWLAAGRRAMEASAMTEALDHFGRGLELAQLVKGVKERKKLEYDLNSSIGFCQISLQGWQAPLVGEYLNAAYSLGRELDERETILPVIYGLWIHWLNRADFEESQSWIDIAERDFGSSGSDDWVLIIRTMKVIQQRWGGSHEGVIENAEEVLKLYDFEKHRPFVYMFGNDPKVATLGFKSWTSWIAGDPERADRERIACREASILVNHPFDRAWQLMVGALTAYFSGQRDEFAASVAEAVELGDKQSVPFVQFILGPVWTGLVHIMDEEWQAAVDIMPQGISAWEQMGGGVALPFWKSSLGYGLVQNGQVESGLTLIEEAIATAERTGEYWFTPEAHRLLAAGLLSKTEPDEKAARAALEKAISLAQSQGAKAWEKRAMDTLATMR